MNTENKLKELGLIRAGDVGKRIGGFLYFHKLYRDRFEHINIDAFELHLPADFEYHIIKVGIGCNTGKMSFISCPTFDELDEPIVGMSIQVDHMGITNVKPESTNPLLYHHRWMLVSDTYDKFCIEESKRRSCWWKEKIGNNKRVSSRIGRKAYWDKLLITLEASGEVSYVI